MIFIYSFINNTKEKYWKLMIINIYNFISICFSLNDVVKMGSYHIYHKKIGIIIILLFKQNKTLMHLFNKND